MDTKSSFSFFSKKSLSAYKISDKIEFTTYHMKGIICALKFPKKSENYILTHENTFSKYKTDRIELFNSTKCEFSPICSLYKSYNKQKSNILSKVVKSNCFALLKRNKNNSVHKIWEISDEKTLDDLKDFFSDKTYYIADGHHLFDTACLYRDKPINENKIYCISP
ncbi:MAG: DUF1015 family protein [Mycoplasma sp.]